MGGAKTVKNKIFSLFMALITLFSITACAAGNDDSDKIKIVTTLFPQYDLAKNIAGDKADVTLLLSPGAESHSFEPTASDIALIQQADLFIYVGGQSEVWVDKILDSSGNKENSLCLFDYISPLEEEHDHNQDHDHDHGNEYDEHIFTSLKNSAKLLDVINDRICKIDSKNADIYNANAKKYKTEIETLDKEYTDMISNAKRKTIVFGDRFPFRYFAQDYGLEWYAAFSGCSSETEASPATISELITKINEEKIPIVFHIEFSNENIAKKISQATGAKIGLLHSCHNISKEDFENGVTYLQLMKNNYEILSEALN